MAEIDERSRGYVVLARKLFTTDPFWSEPRVFSRAEAWVDMIQMAAYRPVRRLIGNAVVELSRGEMLASRAFLARRWGWGEKKVRVYLDLLSKMGRARAERQTPEGPVYLLLNYEAYQATGPAKGRAGAEEKAGLGPGWGRAGAGLGPECNTGETREGSKNTLGETFATESAAQRMDLVIGEAWHKLEKLGYPPSRLSGPPGQRAFHDAFIRGNLRPDGTEARTQRSVTTTEFLDATEAWLASPQWTERGRRFIPKLENYLAEMTYLTRPEPESAVKERELDPDEAANLARYDARCRP